MKVLERMSLTFFCIVQCFNKTTFSDDVGLSAICWCSWDVLTAVPHPPEGQEEVFILASPNHLELCNYVTYFIARPLLIA